MHDSVYLTIVVLICTNTNIIILYHHFFECLPFVKNLSPANVPVDVRQLMMMIACQSYVHIS